MSNKSSGVSGGLGVFLTIIFVILQIAGVIDWEWYWIISPLWIPIAILIGFMLVSLAMALAIGIIILISETIKSIINE